jgi:hypothetical protein
MHVLPGAQAPHQYGRFSDNCESIKVFTEAMGPAKVPIFEDGWIPYCIPCIIKCLAGDSIEYEISPSIFLLFLFYVLTTFSRSLSKICACLGYDIDLISRIYYSFFNPFNDENYLNEGLLQIVS